MEKDKAKAGDGPLQFQTRRRGGVICLEAEAFQRHAFLVHAFCGRHGGVSEGPYAGLNVSENEGDIGWKVSRNREIIARSFDIPADRFLQVDQVHGDRILVVSSGIAAGVPAGGRPFDAIVTDQAGLAVCVRTADCVPILLADPLRQVVGIVHAGWRGTALKVAAKTVEVLTDRFACRREDILAALGPAIGACCYEVDGTVRDAMGPDLDSAFSVRSGGGRWMFDLPGANRLQILASGVPVRNISVEGTCTSCRRDLFFSHRAEGGLTGRQLSFIMMGGPEVKKG
ncbi:MAG: peptidoglycan editing factor PgeF [Deltaproteobacteria bacterium]|nr:peptidoglycan editing factor PgeF [Deltaproteobacteria bacterium]